MNKCILCAGIGLFVAMITAADRPAQPNILLLLADDLGWQDLKCYDIDEPSPMETPNLDALAKKGVQFWQAYSPAPTCSPSRCAIMSGNHPARAQKTHVVGGKPPAAGIKSRMMDPWYSGRMPADTYTLARALKDNGYVTGHAGKWHMAIHHKAFPQATDVGFDYSRPTRGAHQAMKDRLTGFATTNKDDKYRLDKNGFPRDENSKNAIYFMEENKEKPFFLYYCTWLVHGPIMTRNEALLKKYAAKLGVDPKDKIKRENPGQINPFYCAMVESLDYYVAQVFHYLEETDDPRWSGHKLIENTYIIFASDNGGMEGGKERYTDNAPLDKGKMSAKEGGTRVPLIITGPGIPAGIESDVVVNGLDFYPTIISLTHSKIPKNKPLDGCDLAPLLLHDPTNPELVKEADGSPRNTMMWHFPHSGAKESAIRMGDYKLYRNYAYVGDDQTPELELFRLYQTKNGKPVRVDIEEAKNLADQMPELVQKMDKKLSEMLTEMDASYPSYNPYYKEDLAGKEQVPTLLSLRKKGHTMEFEFKENGAQVVKAQLIYTQNAGDIYEEWFRAPAKLISHTKGNAELPAGTTHCFINLIDENNFLVSYPKVGGRKEVARGGLLVSGN